MANLVPPFTEETATQKVQKAEDMWNTKDPEKVALAYTVDCTWRNRDVFLRGIHSLPSFILPFLLSFDLIRLYLSNHSITSLFM